MDREQFEKSQVNAVTKAINSIECAVKPKHLRTVILGTHREKGGNTLWTIVRRHCDLEANQIVAWKFCHTLHKVLRDGQKNVMSDSMKYRTRLVELGKFYGHLRQGYGRLIYQYCRVLVQKLEFHQKNPRIPGNLHVSDNDLHAFGESDVNNWFELVVEMLDYVDEIITLQKEVNNSLDFSRANSLTKGGQCRLAPLILCILDSSCLYDFMVKLLFKLHAQVPPDVLVGHRDRFNGQFVELKRFYYTSSNLQYFKYLVTIPPLPERPPNFLDVADFDAYETPHVHLLDNLSDGGNDTPPDARSVVDDLVDIKPLPPPEDQPSSSKNGVNGFETAEKDRLLDTLRFDLAQAKEAARRIELEGDSRAEQYLSRLSAADNELRQSKLLMDQLQEENERLREQNERCQNDLNQQSASTARMDETEKKAQTNEEKFKKMKDVYSKLREEHIGTLKEKGTLQGQLDSTKERMNKLEEENRQSAANSEHFKQQLATESERIQQSGQEKSGLEEAVARLTSELNSARNERDAVEKLTGAELEGMRQRTTDIEQALSRSTADLQALYASICRESWRLMEDILEQFDNPAHLSVTCNPEYVLTRVGPLQEALDQQQLGYPTTDGSCGSVVTVAYLMAEVVLHTKATANNLAQHDDTLLQKLTDACRKCAMDTRTMYVALEHKETTDAATVKASLAELEQLLKRAREQGDVADDIDADELAVMIEQEMKLMDAAIRDAADKIKDILSKSRETDTGMRLEVNEKILDACNSLMQAVMVLVRKSRDLQEEIVMSGRGTGSVLDFYKRHHQWTEGLLSAAKAVGLGANVLVGSADRVVSGDGKFEELMVASREIAASTAQLVVASRVKAERSSERMSALSSASKTVSGATASVVASVRSGQQALQEEGRARSLDFSHLSLHQAKRAEMDSQVRVLELEQAVTEEQRKLAELRKRHYQLAGPAEGWTAADSGSNSKETTPS